MKTRFVAYYRVSTQQQGRSGLGLDAQRVAVAAFVAGDQWERLAEFCEIETGKGADALSRRPQLLAALRGLSCDRRYLGHSQARSPSA